tara:strand:- start:1182 stop:2933 length:1752 start_codon:yes stop_codon:yes gene_type:complete
MAIKKTYQRQLLSPKYRPNATAEAGVFEQQASGMSQLASSLNKMSNFFYKEMETRAVEEGEMYGAANPITLEQLSNSRKTGEDVLKNYGYGAKGRAARSAALEGLILDVETTALQQFTNIDVKSKQDKVSIEEYADRLDSAVNGYTDMIKKFPEVQTKVKASLSVTANGYLKNYATDVAKIQEQNDKRVYTEAVFTRYEKLGADISAVLDSGGSLADLYNKTRRDISDAAYVTNISPSVFKKDLDTSRDKFTDYLFKAGFDEAFRNDKASDDALALLSNNKTDNERINKIYNFLQADEKKQFIKHLIDQEELNIKAQDDEIKLYNKQNDRIEKDFNTAIIQENYDVAEQLLSQLPIDKQNTLQTILAKRGPDIHPQILNEEQRVKSDDLFLKATRGSLTSKELLDNRENILYADYQTLAKEIVKNQDTEFKNKTKYFTQSYKFDVDLRDLTDIEKNDRQLAIDLVSDLYDDYVAAKALGKTFDISVELRKREKEQITNVRNEANQKLLGQKDRYLKEISYMKYGGPEFGVPKKMLTLEEALQYITFITEQGLDKAAQRNKNISKLKVPNIEKNLKAIREIENK